MRVLILDDDLGTDVDVDEFKDELDGEDEDLDDWGLDDEDEDDWGLDEEDDDDIDLG